MADILSRWAYPASQAFRDVSKHGSLADDEEMRAIIEEERALEKQCMVIKLKQSNPANRSKVSVVTRSGRDSDAPTGDVPRDPLLPQRGSRGLA